MTQQKPIDFTVIKIRRGRALRYTRRMPATMREYTQKCVEEKKTPFLEEFALLIGRSEKELKKFGEAHPETMGAEIEVLKTVQKLDLKRKALKGQYDVPISRILLSAEHDVVERIKKEVMGEGGGAVKTEQVMSVEQRNFYQEEITKVFERMHSGSGTSGTPDGGGGNGK